MPRIPRHHMTHTHKLCAKVCFWTCASNVGLMSNSTLQYNIKHGITIGPQTDQEFDGDLQRWQGRVGQPRSAAVSPLLSMPASPALPAHGYRCTLHATILYTTKHTSMHNDEQHLLRQPAEHQAIFMCSIKADAMSPRAWHAVPVRPEVEVSADEFKRATWSSPLLTTASWSSMAGPCCCPPAAAACCCCPWRRLLGWGGGEHHGEELEAGGKSLGLLRCLVGGQGRQLGVRVRQGCS